MALDRFPKKPCKHCKLMGHFPYECRLNPKRATKRKAGMKRKPIKKVGKETKQWFITRATWVRKNPPPINGVYWECYLRIHEWCPGLVDINTLTLDHVVARTRDQSLKFTLSNLKPACMYCNDKKGSRSLEQVRANNVQ